MVLLEPHQAMPFPSGRAAQYVGEIAACGTPEHQATLPAAPRLRAALCRAASEAGWPRRLRMPPPSLGATMPCPLAPQVLPLSGRQLRARLRPARGHERGHPGLLPEGGLVQAGLLPPLLLLLPVLVSPRPARRAPEPGPPCGAVRWARAPAGRRVPAAAAPPGDAPGRAGPWRLRGPARQRDLSTPCPLAWV